MRVAVLGVGLIGGSIGLAAKRYLDGAEVVGYDVAPLEAALELGAVDAVAETIDAAVAEADACFACAPIGALPQLVANALAACPRDCVVTDVGSTKRAVAAIDDERFIAGHPVAGLEAAGVHSARADLFQGAAWYLTPGARSSGVLYERLHSLIRGFGARPVAIDAEAHDRMLATVSHLPHVLANALLDQAAGAAGTLPRVGPSFRDLTRVAGANPAIWADIYASNAEAIAAALDAICDRLEQAAAMLRGGDVEAIRGWQAAAAAKRRLLEADLAGGPVKELRVTVPNRPGIVAQIALALGHSGVNIVDMSLAPAPDNRSGAISLWIGGEPSSERAEQLIEQLGFPVAVDR